MHISAPSAEPTHATRQTLLPFYVAWIVLMRLDSANDSLCKLPVFPKNDVAVQDDVAVQGPDAMIDRKASLRADPTDSAAEIQTL
jgi:hypothetical protein